MENKIILKSRIKLDYKLVNFFGITLFLLIPIITYFFYPQKLSNIVNVICCYFLIFISFAFTFAYFNLNKIYLFQDYLILKNLLKERKIYYHDILSYYEKNTMNNPLDKEFLIIMKNGKKLFLFNNYYKNYDEIKNVLVFKLMFNEKLNNIYLKYIGWYNIVILTSLPIFIITMLAIEFNALILNGFCEIILMTFSIFILIYILIKSITSHLKFLKLKKQFFKDLKK